MHTADSEGEADRLVAATIYLMTCHARTACPRLACMIHHHLRIMGRHAGVTEEVRDIAQRLASSWSVVRARDERLVMECAASLRPSEGPLH